MAREQRIIPIEVCTHAYGDGFLAGRQMRESWYFPGGRESLHLSLE
jgi:hypothetical protein